MKDSLLFVWSAKPCLQNGPIGILSRCGLFPGWKWGWGGLAMHGRTASSTGERAMRLGKPSEWRASKALENSWLADSQLRISSRFLMLITHDITETYLTSFHWKSAIDLSFYPFSTRTFLIVRYESHSYVFWKFSLCKFHNGYITIHVGSHGTT